MGKPVEIFVTSAAPIVLGGAFLGGFVSGLTGFGTALTALGIWLHVLPPALASTLTACCSVASQLQTLPAIWPTIDRARVWPMLVAGLAGVPVGTALLVWVAPDVFRVSVGVLLLGFPAFMLLTRHPPRITWGGRIADAAVGFGGGVLGGFAGLSGVLPIIWATLRGWGKDDRRAVFQVFNLVILGAAVLARLASGLLSRDLLWLFLLALPGTFAGSWLGFAAYRRLSDRRFRDIVLGLLAFSGASLLWAAK